MAFTSTIADADYYDSEKERELRHIEQTPRLERNEIRQIYAEKGFGGELLDRIVDTITANPEVWVAMMMSEEHQLSPVNRRQAWKVAVVMGISAIVGSLIPLAPFAFMPVEEDAREALRLILQQNGMIVTTAASAREAFELSNASNPTCS